MAVSACNPTATRLHPAHGDAPRAAHRVEPSRRSERGATSDCKRRHPQEPWVFMVQDPERRDPTGRGSRPNSSPQQRTGRPALLRSAGDQSAGSCGQLKPRQRDGAVPHTGRFAAPVLRESSSAGQWPDRPARESPDLAHHSVPSCAEMAISRYSSGSSHFAVS